LAVQQRGFCAPNPSVGAVVVVDNKIIGQGCHQGRGTQHAEVIALQNFEPQPDAILYVSLEPCCHYGRTPPCTDLIIAKKIHKVVYGFLDPNPEVSGRGIEQLQQAGVLCEYVSLPEIDAFYRSYHHWWQTRTSLVTAKIAMSLDGKIAGAQGQPVALTGPDLQRYTHQQRKIHDAILTTVKTVHADDPKLNVRLGDATLAKTVIILDRCLKLRDELNIYQTTAKLIVLHGEAVDAQRRKSLQQRYQIELFEIPSPNEQLNLPAVLQTLGKLGFHDIWLEAGGLIVQSFIEQRLLDRLLVYFAPKWLGNQAQTAFTKPELLHGVNVVQWQQYGQDVLAEFHWR
jgi:diaminohydroxyphosphoribosylaminopyrimidine deaminase/5-amino-6-(5-phosphoribosylamino)uracil reductase